MDEFVDWAHQGLQESDEAQTYLRGRGASPEQWARHRLGYVAGDFTADPSRDPSHDPSICEQDRRKKQQWCDSCHYNWWSSSWDRPEEGAPLDRHIGRRLAGSVVLPLTNYAGGLAGFQIRSLREKSYDTFAVHRRPEGYFFGLGPNVDVIWARREVWLVEGPMDQLVFERLVSPNVIALTTSAVGKDQSRFLRRFVDRVNLCLDEDYGGRKGIRSFFKWQLRDFKEVRDVRYPRIRPGDTDLGDFWKRVGDDRFSEYFHDKAA